MSVNIAVASTRSGSGGVCVPVRNCSASARTRSVSPTTSRLSSPSSSMYRAPGMCCAR